MDISKLEFGSRVIHRNGQVSTIIATRPLWPYSRGNHTVVGCDDGTGSFWVSEFFEFGSVDTHYHLPADDAIIFLAEFGDENDVLGDIAQALRHMVVFDGEK